MQRVTISLDDELAAQFDALMTRGQYENRSEAVRDLIRNALEADGVRRDEARHCVASLTYVYKPPRARTGEPAHASPASAP